MTMIISTLMMTMTLSFFDLRRGTCVNWDIDRATIFTTPACAWYLYILSRPSIPFYVNWIPEEVCIGTLTTLLSGFFRADFSPSGVWIGMLTTRPPLWCPQSCWLFMLLLGFGGGVLFLLFFSSSSSSSLSSSLPSLSLLLLLLLLAKVLLLLLHLITERTQFESIRDFCHFVFLVLSTYFVSLSVCFCSAPVPAPASTPRPIWRDLLPHLIVQGLVP